jgi:hypothetical protein
LKNESRIVCPDKFSYSFIYRHTNNPAAKEHIKNRLFARILASGSGCPSPTCNVSEKPPVTLQPISKSSFYVTKSRKKIDGSNQSGLLQNQQD